MRAASSLVAGLLAALTITLGAAPAPAAEFGIVPGSLTIRTVDASGEPDNRAGAHPDRLQIGLALELEGSGTAARDMVLELPPGLVGDLGAVDACPREIFDALAFSTECPKEAQIGVARITAGSFKEQELPVSAIEPAPGEFAAAGFNFLAKFPLGLGLRPDDYGLSIEQRDLLQVFPFSKLQVELWGVPADRQEGTSIPRRPFLTTPTRCGEPLGVTLRTRSWQAAAPWLSTSALAESPLTGCQDLPFEPRLALAVTSPEADEPTGVRLDLTIPQDQDPDRLASSGIERVTVDLPPGMTISPGAAKDMSACSEAQLHLGEEADAACPADSRVGTVEVVGPQLREPLAGNVYIGEGRPGDRFRLFAVAKGPGIEVKLRGSMRPDPATGRLTAVFPDLPELPFSRLTLRFDDGPRALLVNPLDCGPATAVGRFDPYSQGSRVESTDAVTIESGPPGSGCSGEPPFRPSFVAGVSDAVAGRPTSFSATLRRSGGEQSPERFSVAFPPGLSAHLGALDPCDRAAAASGACPLGSRIGSAVAEVGSGSSLATLQGDVFLTGPYRSAPFGLALAFDLELGPFDLGGFNVLARLRIDPFSGRVSVETDPLPQVIEGLPVRFRTIGLDLDRPGFIQNPTSCAPASVDAIVRSTRGATVSPSSPFFVRRCDRLRFAPRLSMRLTNRSELQRGGKPGLRIRIRSAHGSTNLRRADIALPAQLRFDSAGLDEICARQDAYEGKCPPSSRVGSARGRTPLLGKHLAGAVHVVQPAGSGLPELWTSLDAMGIRFEVRSEVRTKGGRIHTRLVGLPDIPLSEFVLRLAGGKRGILSLSVDPCSRRDRVERTAASFEGQNRAYRIKRAKIATGCGRSAANRGHSRAGGL